MRKGSTKAQREKLLTEWYREQLKNDVPNLIVKWERVIGVQVNDWSVKQMRTKWGTCNRQTGRIWLNLELVKKPVQCLEYVVVHEIVHLLERGHNERFVALMDKFMPKWRHHQKELNQLPLSYSDWSC